MPGEEPKGQHYVHRAYLEGFQDPELEKRGKPALWVYIPNKKPFPQKPDRVAKRNYYYCFHEENKRQFRAEHGLAQLEDLALPILNKIRNKTFDLTADERLTFSGYIALAHTRVPTFERTINRFNALLHAKIIEFVANSRAALEGVARRISEEAGEVVDPEEFRAKLTGGNVIIEQTNRGWTVRQMFEMMLTLQELIFHMKWTYLVTDDDFGFLTSDNPVSLFDPAAMPLRGQGFASSREAHFTFPISRNVCLAARHIGPEGVLNLRPSNVRAVNRANITKADSQLYAPYHSAGIQEIFNEQVNSRSELKKIVLRQGRVVEE